MRRRKQPRGGIIYIHVPKCGGSSFGAALRMRYLMSQATIALDQGNPDLQGEARIVDDYANRSRSLREHVASGRRMIAGHVHYDPALHNGAARNYAFVTLLRDPVARFVSHYHYLQRHHPDPNRPATLGAFLDTRDAARLASQYLFYFAGQTQTMQPDTAPLIQQAITNLARFDLIGDLSAPEAFAQDLRQLTGGRVIHLRRNTAPRPVAIPVEHRPRIEALCAADLEIYRACTTLHCAA